MRYHACSRLGPERCFRQQPMQHADCQCDRRSMPGWALWNETGAETGDHLPTIMTILYEDICAAPLEQSRRMFNFALLDWNKQTESFVRRSVSVRRNEYYTAFRDPSIAANRWRCNVSAEDLRVVESIMRQSKLGKMFLSSN